MAQTKLLPCLGINTVLEDAAMVRGGSAPGVFVRDAVNVNISAPGKIDIVPSGALVTAVNYQDLWQSPLHGDVFATINGKWVKVDTGSWTHEELVDIGDDVSHLVLNNMVCAAGRNGIFTFNGQQAVRLTIDTPPRPMVSSSGTKDTPQRSVAISWCRDGVESGLSSYASAADGEVDVILPMATDPTIERVNVYATNPGGGDMQLAGSAPINSNSFSLKVNHKLGRSAAFKHLSPMPTGKYLCQWRGRLVCAKSNILRFSEALAYHIHDERHGFVQLPQRITFIQPVEGGLWVGQVDHVVFIEGTHPDSMSVTVKSSQPPIAGSAIQIDSEVSGEISEGGNSAALWLASNGYVIGSGSGQLFELQAGRLDSVSGRSGTTVRLASRIITSVN